MNKGPQTRTGSGLARYVGVKQVCEALGISKPTLDRMRRDGRFPKAAELSPNRVGWRVEVIEQHLEAQAGSLAKLCVTDPSKLAPDELDHQARVLAAQAHSKRTGRPVDPAKLSLHLTEQVTSEDFVAREMEEHRIRANYLSRLRLDKAAVVAAVLLPQLRPALADAFAELREMLDDPDELEIEFKLVSDFLTLFELTTRLEAHGIRPQAGQSLLQRLADFDTKRSAVVSAWLFPALRSIYAATDGENRSLFSDQDRINELIVTAMDDERWAEFEQVATVARGTRDRSPKKPP